MNQMRKHSSKKGKRKLKTPVILADDRKRIKIRIDGPDVNGKNTTRQISVLAICVEQVEEFLQIALRKQTP